MNTKNKNVLMNGTKGNQPLGEFRNAVFISPHASTTGSDVVDLGVHSVRATYDPQRGGLKTTTFEIDFDPIATEIAVRNLKANLGVKKKADTST